VSERYKLSFTTGGLFLRESEDAIARFMRLGNWEDARAEMLRENALQVRTTAAAVRISKEVISRLEMLDSHELQFWVDGSNIDKSYLLWSAVCRRYLFVREFASEVLREHFVLLRREISIADFDAFFNSKALWHEELDQLAQSTHHKLRQNLFRMLRDAGFISESHRILQAMPSAELVQLLVKKGAEELLIFPVSDLDIKRWLQ